MSYTDQGAIATDAEYGNLTSSIITDYFKVPANGVRVPVPEIDVTTIGTYQVRCRVADSGNIPTTRIRTV